MLGRLWVTNRLLVIAFAVAVALTLFFGARTATRYVYWTAHREEPVQSWMTIGYIAKSWSVERNAVFEAAGIDPLSRDRRTLARIARERGESVDDLIARIERAVADARAQANGGRQ